ncbi:hypothetical protein R3P38DRAFT_2803775 [Favolaschia claudopus]|uniref:Uncharacterized protein n=1 Tax=Favolaschia claudopus TaxID=2862362 RepID=A0AAV9ZSN5_9AGAR
MILEGFVVSRGHPSDFPNQLNPGQVSTYTLNRWFHFVAIGGESAMPAAYGASPTHTICAVDSHTAVASGFLFLSLNQLQVISREHSIRGEPDKSMVLNAILRHVCSPSCEGLKLVFTRLLRPRTGPFFPHQNFCCAE